MHMAASFAHSLCNCPAKEWKSSPSGRAPGQLLPVGTGNAQLGLWQTVLESVYLVKLHFRKPLWLQSKYYSKSSFISNRIDLLTFHLNPPFISQFVLSPVGKEG